ncbi:MAG: hypothetical protein AB8G96_14475 [Phycisphaerales bacterium]
MCVRSIEFDMFVLALAMSSVSGADFVAYSDFDEWVAEIGGDFSTIGFDEFDEPQTFITDQYEELGVLFDEEQFVATLGSSSFQDGWGGRTLVFQNSLRVNLTEPMKSFGFLAPATALVRFFFEGELLWNFPASGDMRWGFTSDQYFDEVHIGTGGGGTNATDDIYLPPIPGPAGLALLLVAGARGICGRRRRS